MIKENCTIRDVQDRLLDVLIYVDSICKENNIKYFMSGGTLLGAIRHKGFIPWDDDADIMMPREDYEKFVKLVNLDNNKRYKIGSVSLSDKWTRPWTRIWDSYTKLSYDSISEDEIGVFADIFPLDGLPENIFLCKLHYYRVKYLDAMRNAAMRINFIEGENHQRIKQVMKIIARRKGAPYYSKKINLISSKRKFTKYDFTGVAIIVHYMEKEHFAKKIFDKQVELEFEGRKFMGPSGYDKYLTKLYGDYMKMPAHTEQMSTHPFKIEIIEEDK